MKKVLVFVLLAGLLCGCAAAGSGVQVGAPSEPATNASTQENPAVSIPTVTVPKNPGLTLDPYDPEDQVSELTEQIIIQDYCNVYTNLTCDQVRLRFMGVFDDVYVMFVDVKDMLYADVISTEVVAGFKFVYTCSQHMQVWHDGTFYSLQLAFDAGILTSEDLRILAKDYYAANPRLWQYVAVPE